MRKLGSRQSIAMEKLTHLYTFKDYSDLSSYTRASVSKRDTDKLKSFYFDTSEGQNKKKLHINVIANKFQSVNLHFRQS